MVSDICFKITWGKGVKWRYRWNKIDHKLTTGEPEWWAHGHHSVILLSYVCNFPKYKMGEQVILLEENQENDNLSWRSTSEEYPQHTRDFYPIIALSLSENLSFKDIDFCVSGLQKAHMYNTLLNER